jgi:hypothetical protein
VHEYLLAINVLEVLMDAPRQFEHHNGKHGNMLDERSARLRHRHEGDVQMSDPQAVITMFLRQSKRRFHGSEKGSWNP